MQHYDIYNTGYYQVGHRIYTNKLQAVLDASANKSELKWHFHQDVFDSVDWQTPPAKSLKLLYQERAARLRAKYKKVVLLFSGGIDSTTVLESFVDQGLHLDEIVTSWSVRAAEEWAGPQSDRSPENYIGEWNYCIKPRLSQLAVDHPDTKITVIDSTYDILNNVYHDSDFFSFDSYHNLPGMNRWAPLVQHLEKLCNDNDSVAIVLGLDKPQLAYQNSNLYLYFLDVSMHLRSNGRLRFEYFYQDPDGIDIMKCQAHAILDFFKTNQHARPLLNNRNDDLLAVINSVIYPTYDAARFQAGKQKFVIFNEQQSWAWRLSQYQDGRYEDRFKSTWNSFLSVIDQPYVRYKNNVFDGLHGCVGSRHLIGYVGETND